jgi:hypothetical protein
MLPAFSASSRPAGTNHWGALSAWARQGSELTMRTRRAVEKKEECAVTRWPRERRCGLVAALLVGVVLCSLLPRGLALVVGGYVVLPFPLSFASVALAPVPLSLFLAVTVVVVVANVVTIALAVAPTARCSLVVPTIRVLRWPTRKWFEPLALASFSASRRKVL